MIVGAVRVRSSGRYQAWLEGSFIKQVQVWIDGLKIASASYEIEPPGAFVPMGKADLSAGAHELLIVVPKVGLAPGERAIGQRIGPLALDPSSPGEPVTEVEPARAHSLCGRALDWIEIVR
jgi:hypothetical protein